MAGLSNTILNKAITLDNSSTLQHYQDDPFTGSGSYGSFIQNTFWPITSKLINGFTTKNKQYISHFGVQQIIHRFGDL